MGSKQQEAATTHHSTAAAAPTHHSTASATTTTSDNQNIFRQLTGSIVDNPVPFGAIVCMMGMLPMVEDTAQKNQMKYLVGVFAVGLSVHFVYQRWKGQGKPVKGDGRNEGKRQQASSKSNSTNKINNTPLRNIWQAGKSSGGRADKDKNHKDKPFGSKYYYAHNNPNATGGYKDGLKMEDYRMNGPRLLSRNGLSVEEEGQGDEQVVQDSVKENVEKKEKDAVSNKIALYDPDLKYITKYLWDDPGENGIATIRIEVLPDKRPGEYVDWKDVEIEDVQASLAGEGLLVKIAAIDRGKFHLKIPKLYGDAADVKTILKPKRLLVKIFKKKNSFLSSNSTESNNWDAWPQPHRKI